MKAMTLSAFVVLGAVVAVGFWLARQDVGPDAAAQRDKKLDSTASLAESSAESDSPFGVIDNEALTPDSNVNVATTEPVVALDETSTHSDLPSWDSTLSEAQLKDLVARLRADPALFQQLIDEFRQESDPQRKLRLAMVLGEVGGEQATLLASELIFSGDSDERTLGMDLLQDIQPGNAQARDIVSGMLATEVEPDVLIDAMTALSRPGDVDNDSRAFLSDQLAWLTTHQDDGVRSISLDILSRWSDDGRYTDTLLAGLDDDSEYVRGSAAYALAGHEDDSSAVIDRLFSTIRRAGESPSVIRAAILALRSMPLTSAQLAELDAIELRLNTVRR